MPIRQVPNTEYSYYLLIHDERGQERTEDDGSLLSQKVLTELKTQPVTDVFVMSHGWRGDIPAAKSQYDAWMGNLMSATGDIADMKARRPGFRPLLMGLHWPSEPWGDEDASSFDATAGGADPVETLVNDYAKRLSDAPDIREELRTIVHAHATIDDPQSLPPEVKAAYLRLTDKLGLGQADDGAAPWRRSPRVRSRRCLPGSARGRGRGELRQFQFWRSASPSPRPLVLEDERPRQEVRRIRS
jgi:hypothetical protein